MLVNAVSHSRETGDGRKPGDIYVGSIKYHRKLKNKLLIDVSEGAYTCLPSQSLALESLALESLSEERPRKRLRSLFKSSVFGISAFRMPTLGIPWQIWESRLVKLLTP